MNKLIRAADLRVCAIVSRTKSELIKHAVIYMDVPHILYVYNIIVIL